MGERPIQSIRQMKGFNVSEREKFSDVISDSTLELTFKILSLVKTWSNIKEYPELHEKAIIILHPFQVHISVRPNFLYIYY